MVPKNRAVSSAVVCWLLAALIGGCEATTTDEAAGEGEAIAEQEAPQGPVWVLFAAPPAPSIDVPGNNVYLNNARPTFTGYCNETVPADTITIRTGATIRCTTACNGGDSYSCTPASNLPIGTNNYHAIATNNLAENSPSSNVRTITIDVTAPSAPTAVLPSSTFVADLTPTFTGACESGAQVTIQSNGSTACTTTCASSAYSCTPGGSLGEGSKTIARYQTDQAGNQSSSTTSGIIIDVTAPSAPGTTLPAPGSYVNTLTPTFTGTCENSATVTIKEGATTRCTATCSSNAYSCVSNTMTSGSKTITRTQTDQAGNTSGGTTNGFTIDVTAPAAPTAVQPSSTYVADLTPTFTGACESGATVTVQSNGATACTTTCASSAYSCTPGGTLGEGSKTIVRFQTDLAGNQSSSTTGGIVIDVTAPNLSVGSPAQGSTVTTATPTTSGSCSENGVTVQVRVDAVNHCSVPCSSLAYSCTGPALSAGEHTVDAVQTDAAGNTGYSLANDFTVSLAPQTPTLDVPANNALLNNPRPAFTGYCESTFPVPTITIRTGATVRCTTTCSASGDDYSCTPATDLPQGTSNYHAIATNEFGQNSGSSNVRTITIDSVAPSAPTAVLPSSTFVADLTPTFTGACESGAQVTIQSNGSTACTTTCASSAYSCTPGGSLGEGSKTIARYQTDQAGNQSSTTTGGIFIDVTAPSAPGTTAPGSGAYVNTLTPTFTGTCESGATVTMKEGATTRCTALCTSGTYSCVSNTMTSGSKTITRTQTDQAGNTSGGTTSGFTIDVTAPAAPTAVLPSSTFVADLTPTFTGACESGAQVTIQSNGSTACTTTCASSAYSCTPGGSLGEGSKTIARYQTDLAGNQSSTTTGGIIIDVTAPTPTVTVPASGATVTTVTPTISGSCESGLTAVVYDTSEGLLCSSACTSSSFSCVSAPILQGSHIISVTQTDAAGNLGTSAFRTFTVSLPLPSAPVITSPAAGAYVADTTPLVSGTCTSSNTDTVQIEESMTTRCTAACTSNTFSCTSAVLGQGTRVLTPRAVNANGDTVGATQTITIDVTAPSAPTAVLPSSTFVADLTPTFTGACESGAQVTIQSNGSTVCTTTCASSAYSCTPGGSLGEGSKTIARYQTDQAGNQSSSTTSGIIIDVTAPSTPTIVAPAASSYTNDNTVAVSGTCESSTQMYVRDNADVLLCTATCSSGSFGCTTSALTNGGKIIHAESADLAGNISASADRNFFVDTAAPSAPTAVLPSSTFVADLTPTFTGACESGAQVTIQSNGSTVCTTTCASSAYSCTPGGSLGEGSKTIARYQTDLAGNQSSTTTGGIIIDVTAPAPTVSVPASGATVTTATPTVSGACETGLTVRVYDSADAQTCTSTCTASAYSCVTAELANGAQTVRAEQTDAAGNIGSSADRNFTVSLPPPAAPNLAVPAIGAYVADTTPTISGTCENGSDISVREGSTTLCSIACSGSAFSCTSSALSQGSHTIYGRASNANGIADGVPRTFTVDTVAPSTPSIASPAQNSFTTDTTPTISGACETGTQISIEASNGTWCSAACVGGAFSCVATSQAAGTKVIWAASTDLADNTTVSLDRNFVIDNVAPATPSLSYPTPGLFTNDNTVTVTGMCETNALVSVRVDGADYCSATCTGAVFACTGSALSSAAHAVAALQTDAAGNASALSSAVNFTVDTAVPGAPSLSSPTGTIADATPTVVGTCETAASVQVQVDGANYCAATCAASAFACTSTTPLGNGARVATARQTDAAGNLSAVSATLAFTIDTVAPGTPFITSPATSSYTSDVTPLVSGTCETAATVTITQGATVRCAAVCAASQFSCTSTTLAPGSITLSAAQVDAAGNASASSSVTFTVDTTAPAAPIIVVPAAGSHTNDLTPTISGTCETGAQVDAFVDGAAYCTTSCASGTFACASATPLANGTRSATARQTDLAGNLGVLSAERLFTIDTTPPAAPVINTPASNATINTTTPSISGSCETAAAVEVLMDGAPYCVATCAAASFSCDGAALSNASHTATARQTDAAGNLGALSAGRTFTVDTLAPPTPVVTLPANPTTTNNTNVSFVGTCEVAATVEVRTAGSLLCSTTCTAGGAFSCAAVLTPGVYAYFARQRDGGNNVSGDSAARALTIDTTAPNAPTLTSPSSNTGTTDTTPAFIGTCETAATVAVIENGSTLCTAVCAAGSFTCSPAVALAAGAHGVSARQTDVAGNLSPTSTTIPFEVWICSDGSIDGAEVCDDGDAQGGDGCSASCTLEPGWLCGGEPTVCVHDTDLDGIQDALDNCPTIPNADQLNSDGDGQGNSCDADDDNDGAADGVDNCPLAANSNQLDSDGDGQGNACDADDDADGLIDGADNCPVNFNPTQTDVDGDGQGDACDLGDADGDGLSDAAETLLGTRPNDADSDDDGVVDGSEAGHDDDTDGDGAINALDPDSDNDRLFDGTELGLTSPHAATDLSRGSFVADADPGTTTNPRNADSDNGGTPDGAEDSNHNGAYDAGETDPNNGADDTGIVDGDSDGLSDTEEIFIGTDPVDADTDDDGLIDGLEPNANVDSNGDGLINALDPDSDGDGLFDGLEYGLIVANADTNVAAGHYVADADPATRTGVLTRDSDHGGIGDGQEDANLNGRVDVGETDPLAAGDDFEIADRDDDGLPDLQEVGCGTATDDADVDDDGVLDGAEASPCDDVDGDELANALDADSDNDGLTDGTELGLTSAHADTNLARGHFIADADPSTQTSPVDADSDGGGVEDGVEDANQNGRVDAGETDPNDGDDDLGVDEPEPPGPGPEPKGGGGGCAASATEGVAPWSGLVLIAWWLASARVWRRRRLGYGCRCDNAPR